MEGVELRVEGRNALNPKPSTLNPQGVSPAISRHHSADCGWPRSTLTNTWLQARLLRSRQRALVRNVRDSLAASELIMICRPPSAVPLLIGRPGGIGLQRRRELLHNGHVCRGQIAVSHHDHKLSRLAHKLPHRPAKRKLRATRRDQ